MTFRRPSPPPSASEPQSTLLAHALAEDGEPITNIEELAAAAGMVVHEVAALVAATIAKGFIIAINSDTHSTAGLGNMIFGVMSARRAWLTPEQILNCWPADDILARHTRRIAEG